MTMIIGKEPSQAAWRPSLETKEKRRHAISEIAQTKVITSTASSGALDKVAKLFKKIPLVSQTQIFQMAQLDQEQCEAFVISREVGIPLDRTVGLISNAMRAWYRSLEGQKITFGRYDWEAMTWKIVQKKVFRETSFPYFENLLNLILKLPAKERIYIKNFENAKDKCGHETKSDALNNEVKKMPDAIADALNDEVEKIALPTTEEEYRRELFRYANICEGGLHVTQNGLTGFLHYLRSGHPLHAEVVGMYLPSLSFHINSTTNRRQQTESTTTFTISEAKGEKQSDPNYSVYGDYAELSKRFANSRFSTESESIYCMWHLMALSLQQENCDQIAINNLILEWSYSLIRSGGTIPNFRIEHVEWYLKELNKISPEDREKRMQAKDFLARVDFPSLLRLKINRCYEEEILIQSLKEIIDQFQNNNRESKKCNENLKEKIYKHLARKISSLGKLFNPKWIEDIISLLAHEKTEVEFERKLSHLLEEWTKNYFPFERARAIIDQEKVLNQKMQTHLANVCKEALRNKFTFEYNKTNKSNIYPLIYDEINTNAEVLNNDRFQEYEAKAQKCEHDANDALQEELFIVDQVNTLPLVDVLRKFSQEKVNITLIKHKEKILTLDLTSNAIMSVNLLEKFNKLEKLSLAFSTLTNLSQTDSSLAKVIPLPTILHGQLEELEVRGAFPLIKEDSISMEMDQLKKLTIIRNEGRANIRARKLKHLHLRAVHVAILNGLTAPNLETMTLTDCNMPDFHTAISRFSNLKYLKMVTCYGVGSQQSYQSMFPKIQTIENYGGDPTLSWTWPESKVEDTSSSSANVS